MSVASEYVFPTSSAQGSFWFLHRLHPESPFYNVPIALRFTGSLDATVLAQAFEAMLERHEPLRTVFRLEGGAPVQIVAEAVHPESRLQTIDLAGLPFAEADRRAQALISEGIVGPFDLHRGPVIRARLMRVTPADHRLLIVMHHIVADVPSCDVLIRELAALYEALRRGHPAELAPLELQYGDYAVWQRDALQGVEFEKRLAYWREQLRPPIPVLRLPSDRLRPAFPSFNGASLQVPVPDGAGAAFLEFCRQRHVTLFTAALAAYATLLYRCTGETDVLIGSPVSNRSMRELEPLIGLFLNTVVLRVEVKPGEPFGVLLTRVQRTVLDAFEQEVPFEKLVEELKPERDLSRSPFFQTMLTVRHSGPESLTLPEVEIAPLTEVAWETSKFDLTVVLQETDGHLSVGAEYSTDLFDRDTIAAMLDQFVTLLDVLARHPDCMIGALDPPTPSRGSREPVGKLVQRLQSLGLRLSLESGRLKVSAPKGVMDEAIKSTITARRTEIIDALSAAGADGTSPLRRIPRTAPLPLTSAQRRFWFVDRIEQGRGAQNLRVLMRIEGFADLHALTRALEAIVERHESLRMRIGERDGEPYPEIIANADGLVRMVDLTKLPEAEREAEGLRLSQAQSTARYDLTRGPLAGMLVVRLAPDVHLVTISTHHIIADGWSLSIVVREFGAFYSALARGEEAEIASLPVQYVDYAAWEGEQVRAGLFERQLAYWKRKLAHAPALLELPTDRPRPPMPSFRGARVDRVIDAAMVEELKRFSQRHEATLFMMILAAWQVLLHRYSGQDDIVIGTPMANRGRPELEPIVGLFVNSLALRANLSGNPAFTEFLAQVRQTTIEALDHREVPFDMVVEVLNPTRSLDHAPIFQVMFALHNFPMEEPYIGGLESSFVEVETRATRFDLLLNMVIHQGSLVASYEYATDLFDITTIERMHDHLVRLLAEIMTDATRQVRELLLLSSTDERILVDDWNKTSASYDDGLCVHHLFERIVRSTPGAPAVTGGGKTLSYRELDERANQLAHLLRRRGIVRGARVAICLDRGVDMPIAMAAVLKAGAAYVPLDPAHPPDRLSYILEDVQAACVITVGRFRPLLNANASLVLLDESEAELADLEIAPPDVAVSPDDLAYVIYTSGSTGRPKGVQIEHRNVVNFVQSMQREPGLVPSDVLLAVTTLSFDIAGLEIWLPLSVGAKVVIASRGDVLDGGRLIELLEEHSVTVMQATPASWRLLLGAGWSGKPDLKVLCGGEALPRDLAAELSARVGQLWNMYGPTETTIWSTASLVTDPSGGIPIGRPIANTRIYVLEPSGLLAPIGGFGELVIAGEGVARGYWNRPELTAEKFVTITLPGGRVERVYRTGDLARFRADGQLEFLGRRDHQIKLRGYRIELGEIEAVLAIHPGVTECVVSVREDEPGDQRLVGYVVVAEESAFDPDFARAMLRTKIPAYMIPSEFVVLPSLPLTPNGKIDRSALPVPERAIELAANESTESVMNPIQRRVADIWCKILRLKRVGLHDNFFDVGGQSMLIVRLHGALQREFGGELTLTELFQQTTVAAQAHRMSSAAVSDASLSRAGARARKQIHA